MTISIGWHDNLSAAEYLADPCEAPSLSSSIASLLVSKSPWHAWRAHPRLGGIMETTDELDRGAIVHALVLGELHRFAILDFDDFRTKAAREARNDATSRGFLPIKRSQFEQCASDAEGIRAALASRYGIVFDGMKIERSAIWRESGALCRARLDAFDGTTIYDLKTTRDASPCAIERAVRAYDYHVQRAAYVSAVEHLEPAKAGRVRYVLLFVENDTNEVVPVQLGGMLETIGANRWKRAVNAWGKCLAANQWPGYAPRDPLTIECSEWASTSDQVAALELRERMATL